MKKYLWVILFLIALILRMFMLGGAPFSVANDELSYIYSAYSIWITHGFDITGKFLPISINLDSSLSPVPVYLISPFVGILGLSAFSGRLIFAILGSLSVVFIYLLAFEIFNSKKVAFLSGLVLAFSPWHIAVSRTAWDGEMALFFYLVGVFIFIRNLRKNKNINWSIPFFLLGFYSYHATKVFYLGFVIFAVIYLWNILKNKKQIYTFILLNLLIFASFLLVMKFQNVTRQESIIFDDRNALTSITQNVNKQRSQSSAPPIVSDVFINKAGSIFNIMAANYLGAFSPEFLFTIGDHNPINAYGYFQKGMMYLIDAPFLLLGLIYSFQKLKKDKRIFLIALFLLAPLPAILGYQTSYIIRGIMLLIPLSITTGFGLFIFINFIKTQKLINRNIIYFSLFIVYLIFVSKFIFSYYFQMNYFGSEYFDGSSRTLSLLIEKNYSKYSHFYVVTSDDHVILQYAFWNKINPEIIQKLWPFKEKDITIGKTTFLNSCFGNSIDSPYKVMPKNSMYIVYVLDGSCYNKPYPGPKIVDPMEPLRTIYNVYEKN